MSSSDLDHAWNAVVRRAREHLADSSWDTWLALVRPVRADEARIVVRVPDHARAWVAERVLPLLSASATEVYSRDLRVELEDAPATLRPGDRRDRRSGEAPIRPTPTRPDRPLSDRMRFEDFVLGPTNRFAHAAALTVAENPGVAYNPLFLCGPPGVGKTHLLHAIGRYALDHHPGIRVRYASAETFTTEFLGALRDKGVDVFKERYREIDLLLVDDVQFLIAKRATEEEFFHTFNVLHEAGAQVVLTADRVPHDFDRIEDRLRERFASGLVAEVERPDVATRLMVLRQRVGRHAVEVEPDALEAIARRVTESVRAVEAALVRVVAYASLTERRLDAALAHEVLASLYPESRRTPGTAAADTTDAETPASFAAVLRASAETFGVSEEDLRSKGTGRDLVWARSVAMYVARSETGWSYPVLGRAFDRNHTTVLGAVRRLEDRVARDPAAQADVARVRDRARRHGVDPQADGHE